MDVPNSKERPPAFLSLRWKVLIALSLVLLLVHSTLAWMAYRQSVHQFELQQAGVRQAQVRQLRALLDDRFQELSKLAGILALVGPQPPEADMQAQLRTALDVNGVLFDLEWDIRSVHWVDRAGTASLIWAAQAQDVPPQIGTQIARQPEATVTALACRPECRQYTATPMLWGDSFGGTLVLARSVADGLLSFSARTGAEGAILTANPPTAEGVAAEGGSPFPAVTHKDLTLAVLDKAGVQWQDPKPAAGAFDAGGTGLGPPLQVQLGGDCYEIFRVPGLAPGVDALVVDNVTAQQAAIREATLNSIVLGALGLILSESLLLLIMQTPVARLRRLAAVLPLLAENRYADLRARLPKPEGLRLLTDEMDLMVGTVEGLTDRMEVLQRDREEAEARLVWLADHDPLTHLYNRRRFNGDFIRILDQAQRFGRHGALLFFDLDQFKDVNDLSGHQVGDLLLQQVAEHLRDMAHPSDLLARLGGDEFALVLPEAASHEAVAAAEQVQVAIRSIILHERGRHHQVSASIGVVLFPDHGDEAHQLLANADLAMYQAKEKGRGRWHLFSDVDQAREQADARVLWREQIAEAIKHDRFELRIQPILDIAANRVCYHEALLRMRDARGDLVYPDRFIPVAEKTGQIQAIDRWVLTHACEAMHRDPQLCLSVNLSAHAMSDPTVLPDLERLLARYRITPSRLSFEVTETAAINSLLNATRLMQGIQQLGCRFALDDFGSGFASYAYLRQLPVDDVKIDGAFIRDLASRREDRIFVKAITDMAHGMGKHVIAEFVETPAILAILADLGVDYAQGYHIGRPVPVHPIGSGETPRVG